jgi:hypothetical protein
MILKGGAMTKFASAKLFASLILLAALAIPVMANGATVQPVAGIYSVSSYVVSATATNGGSCGAPQGAYLSSYFYYPGPAKSGAVERHSINGANGNEIQELDFPTTPATGIDTWSGDYTSTIYPSGRKGKWTFSTDWTFVDADSFLATTTYVYSGGTDSVCTTVFQNSYIRTGN